MISCYVKTGRGLFVYKWLVKVITRQWSLLKWTGTKNKYYFKNQCVHWFVTVLMLIISDHITMLLTTFFLTPGLICCLSCCQLFLSLRGQESSKGKATREHLFAFDWRGGRDEGLRSVVKEEEWMEINEWMHYMWNSNVKKRREKSKFCHQFTRPRSGLKMIQRCSTSEPPTERVLLVP